MGRYLTNQLMGRELLLKRIAAFNAVPCGIAVSFGINSSFPELFPTWGQITHVFLTLPPLGIATSFDLHA